MSRKIILLSSLALFTLLLSVLMFGPALTPAQAQEPAVACESDVVVQPVDSLSKLAAKFYGDPKAFIVIVKATNAAAATDSSYATITDPNVVLDGSKLCIPSAADAQAMLGGQMAAAPAPAAVTSTTVITEGSQGCETHLQDGANAVMTTFSNLRGIRYCEISMICGSQATMYNSSALNNLGNPMDTCDPGLWAGVDEGAMATEFDVPGVWKNGPRFWTNDVIAIPVGTELDFNGWKAAWFAYPKYPPNIQNLGITAGSYITTTVARSSVMTFTAGQPIFIMDDPSGQPWVMQAAAQIVNPNLTYGDLMTLDTQLDLPEGWSYRVKTIDQDLVIVAVNGFAQITQDSLGNSYDGCIELDGEPTCNFVP